MKRLLFLLMLFAIIAAPVYSVVIGVSPNVKNLCMVPGENATAIFTVSSASNRTETLSIQVMNLSWVTGDKRVSIPSMSGVPTTFYVETAGLPEGMYTTDLYYCAEPIVASIPVKSCIKSQMNVNLSYACSENYDAYAKAKQGKELLYCAFVGALLAALALFFYRKKVSKIKKARKR